MPPPRPGKTQRSRRNQDMNHLLGFTFAPRPVNNTPSVFRKRNQQTTNYQQYIFSAYRFIVDPTKDYSVNFADPDVYFEWDHIVQVVVDTSTVLPSSLAPEDKGDVESAPNCPVCLCEPTAPRITRCGHVFCLACILHFLALSENKWRSCPVCWKAVYERDLKPVYWSSPLAISLSSPSPSASIVSTSKLKRLKMRLVYRESSSTIALPRSTTWPIMNNLLYSQSSTLLNAPWDVIPDITSFSRFFLASPTATIDALKSEASKLRKDIQDTEACENADLVADLDFFNKSLVKIDEEISRAEEMKGIGFVMKGRKQFFKEVERLIHRNEDRPESDADLKHGVPVPAVVDEVAQEFISAPHPESSTIRIPEEAPAAPTTPTPSAAPVKIDTPTAEYLFYQAASGERIFLEPLDIKILKAHFKTYDAMPETIEIGIEQFEQIVLTPEYKKRMKWLSHLPTSSQAYFVEASLEGIVPREALKPFTQALKQRRNKRKQKQEHEEEARVRWEAQQAVQHVPDMHIPTWEDFPVYQPQSIDNNLPDDFSVPTGTPTPGTATPTTATSTVWGTPSVNITRPEVREDSGFDVKELLDEGKNNTKRKKGKKLVLGGGVGRIR